jgi:hypothetical protein
LTHPLAGRDRVLQTINAYGWFTAGQTDAAHFLAQHMHLLSRHGASVGLDHASELVLNLFSAPGFFHYIAST